MFRAILFAALIAAPRQSWAIEPAADYEQLIEHAESQLQRGNPLEAAEAFRRAFDAMPAELKRQELGEDIANRHWEARAAAWRADGDVDHFRQAKRMLEILIAEQQAGVAAGTREAVSKDATATLALVDEQLARHTASATGDPTPPPPVVDPAPAVVIEPPIDRPDLSMPIALLTAGGILGVGGIACLITAPIYRGYNTRRFEDLSAAQQAARADFPGDIKRDSIALYITGAVALAGGIAMTIPGAIIYQQRSSAAEARLTPSWAPGYAGATLQFRF